MKVVKKNLTLKKSRQKTLTPNQKTLSGRKHDFSAQKPLKKFVVKEPSVSDRIEIEKECGLGNLNLRS